MTLIDVGQNHGRQPLWEINLDSSGLRLENERYGDEPYGRRHLSFPPLKILTAIITDAFWSTYIVGSSSTSSTIIEEWRN